MQDKRISLRFRTDKEPDMKAWNLLESMAKEKNTSKNSVVIDALIAASIQKDSKDELAERIADLVVNKIAGKQICSEASKAVDKIQSNLAEDYVSTPQADEPELLGESALDFLGMFG